MAARWRAFQRVAVLVLVSMAFVLFAQSAFAVGGSVTGKVTDFTNGQALSGASVDVMSWDSVIGDWVVTSTAVTDVSGDYTLGAIPPGEYYLRATFSSVTTSYACEYEPGSFTGFESSPMVWNPALVPDTSLVEGAVTSGGSPVLGVPVFAYRYNSALNSWDVMGWTYSDAVDGTYKIKTSDLFDPKAWSGTYKVGVDRLSADNYDTGTHYLGSFWGGGSTPDAGADVAVTSLSSPVVGKDLTLTPMVKIIAGNVTDRITGSGIANAMAVLTDKNGNADSVMSTDMTGYFELWADPAAGPYKFQAMCPSYVGHLETGLTWTGTTRTGDIPLAIDVTAPNVTCTLIGDKSESAALTISVTDDSLYMCDTTYSINGGASAVYTDKPLTFTSPGTYVVTITSVDNAGNTTVRTRTVTVVSDATAPVLSVNVTGYGTPKVTLNASATDNSGIAPVITYTVNGGPPVVYTSPVSFTVAGAYTIFVSAKDAAGNVSPSQGGVYRVSWPVGMPERISGANRYDVAINTARSMRASLAFSDVIIACGEDRAMADPLGAAALASAYDCPVLLTPTAKTNPGTVATIKAMAAANGGRTNIHVVGGTASIPKSVYASLSSAKGAGTIERINGANRYDLAYRIAARTKAVLESKGKTVSGVIVVNIENPASFNDALAVSPISARAHLPLIGVRGDAVPTEANAALALFAGKPRFALNSAYLSTNVRNAAGCATSVATLSDRTGAAVQIARWGVANHFVSYKNVGLANKLSDALPAGPQLGQFDGVLLYTDSAMLPGPTASHLLVYRLDVQQGWVFGGPATITDATKNSFYEWLH